MGGEAAFCAGVLVDYLRVTTTGRASLERPQKLQHSLNIRRGAGCGGGQGGCPAHGRPAPSLTHGATLGRWAPAGPRHSHCADPVSPVRLTS